MRLIRIDENSTERGIKEVLSLEQGAKFYMDPKFIETFTLRIPQDSIFRFLPIVEGSEEYAKYGRDCFKVVENRKVIVLG